MKRICRLDEDPRFQNLERRLDPIEAPGSQRLGGGHAAKVSAGRMQPLTDAVRAFERLAETLAEGQKLDEPATCLTLRIRLSAQPAVECLPVNAQSVGKVLGGQTEIGFQPHDGLPWCYLELTDRRDAHVDSSPEVRT